MFNNLSQREKVMIYSLLGLVGIFVLYKYVWLKQMAVYSEAKANYQQLSNKVQQYKQIAATADGLKKEEGELQKKLEEVTSPFSIDLMGGEQIRVIGQIIENAGLKVEQAAPIGTDIQKDYYTQDIKFQVQGTYGSLEQFFFDTEYSKYAFVIKKFNISPKISEGTDPKLVGLNYNNLNADLIVTVIGDKTAKVEQPILQSFKLDLFKPTDQGMQAMKNLKQQQELAAAQSQDNQAQSPDATTDTTLPTVPAVSLEDTTAVASQNEQNQDSKYKAKPAPKEKEYKLNYNFDKR